MTEEEDEDPILATQSMSSSSLRRRNSRSNENHYLEENQNFDENNNLLPSSYSTNLPQPEISYLASLTSSQVPNFNNLPIQSNDNRPISQYEPQKSNIRFVLCWLAMLGFAIVYILRVNMSIAIVAMTSNSTNTTGEGTFDWTEKQKGEILGSFFYGYVASQILGGYLSDKYNIPATVFGVGVAGTSILTAFTPMAARMGITPLCVLRVFEGVFEGVTIPAITSFWGKWAPPDERSRLQGWSLNGTILGTVIGLTSTAFLSSIEGLGWESSFYIFGFIGLFWCWIWFMIASDTPGNNDWISSFEKNYIAFSLQSSTPSSHTPFPFKKAFKTSAVWAIIIAHFCYGWGLYTILNDLPLFLSEVLHLSVKSTALFSSLPQVICWLTGLGLPILADVLIENNFSRTTVRKIFQATCFIGGASVIILIAILGYLNQWIVLILLVLNSIFNAFTNCGLGCAHLDMAAQHAGTLFGITNTFGNLPGFLVPITVGILTQNDPHDRASWYWVWAIMAIFMSFGAVVFVVFGDMRPQKWAIVETGEDANGEDANVTETNRRTRGENYGISSPISENDEDLITS